MIGRRTTVGLSLLCALAFCAFAAQSASAAKAVNTTAFTCVEGGKKDFKDAHCDEAVAEGTGKFGHELIPLNTTTKIEVDNTTTGGATSAAVLKSKAFGAAVEISCATVSGTGELHNVETETKKHTITGTVTVKYTKCTVAKPAKCEVAEPIEVKAIAEGVEGNGPEKNTMGVEFKPDESENFVEISFKNKGAEACSLNAKTFPVKGTAIATGTPSPSAKHSGATAVFTDAMTTETLKFGPEPAGFDSIGTVKMHKEDSVKQNPISLTTTT